MCVQLWFLLEKPKNMLIVSIILVILCFKNGAAIKCFVCDSSDNPSCADLKSNSTIAAEDCSLEKMRSIDSWLFDLNRFDYFDTGANKEPLMNCQKVVARNPHTHKLVTARFCQLDTGDSDACAILINKLRQQGVETLENSNNNNNKDNNGWRNKEKDQSSATEEQQQFHCSICSTDSCNGAVSIGAGYSLTVIVSAISLMLISLSHYKTRFNIY